MSLFAAAVVNDSRVVALGILAFLLGSIGLFSVLNGQVRVGLIILGFALACVVIALLRCFGVLSQDQEAENNARSEVRNLNLLPGGVVKAEYLNEEERQRDLELNNGHGVNAVQGEELADNVFFIDASNQNTSGQVS